MKTRLQMMRASALRQCRQMPSASSPRRLQVGVPPLRRSILLALLICTSPARGALADVCSPPIFAAAGTFTAGTNPVFVVVSDLNGDGKSDLLVANQGSYDSISSTYTNSSISVLLGNGDGTFQRAVNYGAGANLFFVAVGDFNGDNRLDLAAGNEGWYDPSSGTFTNSSISVLLGKGDGTFQSAVKLATVSARFAVGDFNRDGKSDLAIANYGAYDESSGTYTNSSVSVRLGNGDGTFQAPVEYRASYSWGEAASEFYGRSVASVAVGDFNGDGKLDLVTARAVLLGNGDGTFQKAVNYNAEDISTSVALGDFNSDGTPDLAVANLGRSDGGSVSVLLGKGDGTFHIAANLPLQHPYSLAVGDFNGDGIPDLVVNPNDGFISVLLGNGDGTFQRATLPIIAGPFAVGDFNGDRKPDLAVVDGSPNISVLLNAGVSASPNPTFAEIGLGLPLEYDGSAPVVGDFNGDGKPDLAFPDVAFPDYNSSIFVLLGRGDGTFQSAGNYYDAGVPNGSMAAGDFNGDGKLDLAVGHEGSYDPSSGTFTNSTNSSISVLLGKGDGTFQSAVKLATVSARFAVGDFNRDGKSDLAIANYGPFDQSGTYTNSSVSVLLGNGDGTFQAPVEYRASYSWGEAASESIARSVASVAVGDFNGDGKLDLVTARAVLLGKGDGTFEATVNYDPGANAYLAAVADFNGDGKSDVAISYLFDQSTGDFTNSSFSVRLGNGDGSFQAAPSSNDTMGIGNLPQIAVGDLNGDGKPDMMLVNFLHGIFVLLGGGDGTFQPAFSYGDIHSIHFEFVAVADLNGDGKLDFVAGEEYGPIVWLNTSCSAGPRLAIVRNGSALTLSWPLSSAGYVLESSTSLNATSWKPADTVPVNKNAQWEVTVPTTQSQGYFRLHKP